MPTHKVLSGSNAENNSNIIISNQILLMQQILNVYLFGGILQQSQPKIVVSVWLPLRLSLVVYRVLDK